MDIMNSYAVIMAGGTGTRLWPLSRVDKPKQSLPLTGVDTMFQVTVERIKPLFPFDHILVVTNERHKMVLRGQVPEIPERNYVIEPEGRGTAPCIGLAAVHIMDESPDAVMTVLTADHYIADSERFRAVLIKAMKTAEKNSLVTLGIVPIYASTGYGYIRRGGLLDPSDPKVYRTAGFLEKPNQAKANEMLSDGGYFWNSGMFVWRVKVIMEEFRRQMPTMYKHLSFISEGLRSGKYDDALSTNWGKIPRQTIDYGVMEGADDVSLIPGDFGWSDIGSWSALKEVLEPDAEGNVVRGVHLGIDTSGSLILGGKRLIATIGLENFVVVDSDDALLICPLRMDQRVREVVEQLKKGREKYL
jgi:mannose-1-phosphate guanylyltransferase